MRRLGWIAPVGVGLAVVIVALGAAFVLPRKAKPISVLTDDASTRIARLRVTPTLPAAVAYVKPVMADTDASIGHLLLAIWAADHLRWADVEALEAETSLALFRKDPDAERGKRLCVDALVLSIRAEPLGKGKTYEGILLRAGAVRARDENATPYRFTAVRSTGDVVERSDARFCGIATGRFSYDSPGGKREGLQLVGMFDLPENRTP